MKSLLGSLFNRSPIPLSTSSGTGLLSTLTGGSPTKKALESMGKVGTLFAIVNRTSNSTARVEWSLFRRNGSGLKKDRTEVPNHAALDLWRTPNATTTTTQFVEGFQQHVDLTGEGWWIIGRNPASTMPLEMWYVRPDRMQVLVDAGGISGYVYRAPNGDRIPLAVDQVISLIMPNPLDPWRGMGPVQSIFAEIDSYRFTAEWNRRFFLNSAEPGGIVEVTDNMSDVEFERMRLRWAETHQGVSNAHRVAILEGGAKWVSNAMTMRDMQFMELREVSRDTIREAFGFPKAMLGAADDVNRANALAAAAMFADDLLVPRLERIKTALNFQLLPLFGTSGKGLEFDYANPVPSSAVDDDRHLGVSSLAAERLIKAGFDPAGTLESLGLPAIKHSGGGF